MLADNLLIMAFLQPGVRNKKSTNTNSVIQVVVFFFTDLFSAVVLGVGRRAGGGPAPLPGRALPHPAAHCSHHANLCSVQINI